MKQIYLMLPTTYQLLMLQKLPRYVGDMQFDVFETDFSQRKS